MSITGLVIRATGSWYEVLHEGERLQCRIRGRLRLKGVRSTNPVVVGDTVHLESDERGEWVICDIAPRRNYIIRRASNLSKESHIIAANIDRAMIVVTLIEPVTALEFVDRFLITCEAYKVPVTILLAKCDLLQENPEAIAEFHNIYESAGYEVIDISATEGWGVERIKDMLAGKVTLLSGNSGVGKSTLVSKIDPSLDVRTGEISESFHMPPTVSQGFNLTSKSAEKMPTVFNGPQEVSPDGSSPIIVKKVKISPGVHPNLASYLYSWALIDPAASSREATIISNLFIII